jgi:hypothetical protein
MLSELAHRNPTGAVLAAYANLTTVLEGIAQEAGISVDPRRRTASGLAAIAANRGIITEASAESVRGVTVMRNLAAHSGAGRISPSEALEYLALVDATLYSLTRRPTDTAST